jgi:hypothetical protein
MRSFITPLYHGGRVRDSNPGRRRDHSGTGVSATPRCRVLKDRGGPTDARGVDPISANLEAVGAAITKDRKVAKALGAAMVKLIEASASPEQKSLPTDATFHTYA